MVSFKICALLALATVAYGSPAFWKGTALDSTVEEMRSLCANDDAIACLKFRAMSFLDTIFKKDNYQVGASILKFAVLQDSNSSWVTT